MAVMKQDIPNRVTVYHDNIDQRTRAEKCDAARETALL